MTIQTPDQMTEQERRAKVSESIEQLRENAKLQYHNAIVDFRNGKVSRKDLVAQLTIPSVNKWHKQSFLLKMKLGQEHDLLTQQLVSSKSKLAQKFIDAYNKATQDYEIMDDYDSAEAYALDFSMSMMEMDQALFNAMVSSPLKQVRRVDTAGLIEHLEFSGKICMVINRDHWDTFLKNEVFAEHFDPIDPPVLMTQQGVVGNVVVNNKAPPKILLSTADASHIETNETRRGVITLTDGLFPSNMRMAPEYVVAIDQNFRFDETIVWSKEHKRFACSVDLARAGDSSFDLYTLI